MLSGSGAGDYRYVIDALAAAVFLLPADETPVTPEPTPVPAPRLAEVYAGEAKIRPDMAGPAVEVIQKQLTGVGKTAPLTGVWDAESRAAYKSWQSKFGYWPTGTVTGKQATYLKKLYGNGKLPKICRTGRVLCVDKHQLVLRAMKNGKQQLVTDVRFGSSETPTRNGKFGVYSKVPYLISDLSGTPMPFSLFFSGGQAVHFSPGFRRDGYNGSSLGCVNVRSLKDAKWIYHHTPLRTPVYIYRSGR